MGLGIRGVQFVLDILAGMHHLNGRSVFGDDATTLGWVLAFCVGNHGVPNGFVKHDHLAESIRHKGVLMYFSPLSGNSVTMTP